MAENLGMTRFNFTHVHGLKDKKMPFVDLTVFEKLNVLCNEGAKEALHMAEYEIVQYKNSTVNFPGENLIV